MISLKHGLPLVRNRRGASAAFDPEWLRSTLSSAAGKAGYPDWWLADDMTEGILFYLRHGYRGSVIDLSRLENVIRSVLCNVGYGEVAMCFRTVMPCHRISLAECLPAAPECNQAEFFSKLREQIELLDVARPQHVHFSELHECVRALADESAGRPDGKVPPLLQEVVAFVRDRVQSMAWHPQVRCSIS